jgi:lipopolysaccharide transport system ATP-binding protein
VIRVDNLGKKYVIQREKGTSPYRRFSEEIVSGLTRPFRRRKTGERTANSEEFWALRDVSFEVAEGEAVGIIGRNGAGKSTLLKILSRITEPTLGRVCLKGRVASLLEVGTGFHPELTGRENIFLNGSILGMTRAEIRSKFDQIVDFSGVEQFIDTPVKRYSSGMAVRLAFSVAAHLDPEILIVDEVLAVGDVAFQRKCLEKMGNIGASVGAILFVSHNLGAVRRLCTRGIWLENGHCKGIGDIAEVTAAYAAATSDQRLRRDLNSRTDREGSGRARIIGVRVTDREGHEISNVRSGDEFTIRLQYRLAPGENRMNDVVAAVGLFSNDDYVWLVRSTFTAERLNLADREGEICCHVKDFAIAEGTYQLETFLSHRDTEIIDWLRDAVELRVEPGDFFGTGQAGLPTHCRTLTRAQWAVAGNG